ncbi:MAG: hypothetical protein U0271_13335 [Polyangiaceae bacterium]
MVRSRAQILFVACLPVCACLGSDHNSAPSSTSQPSAPQARVASAKTAESPIPEATLPPPPATDAALDHELDTLRDPFIATANATPLPPDDDGRDRASVAFANTPISELKVRGTLLAGPDGRALLADASGKTQVVLTGALIGQRVRDQDGVVKQWRVDRIREGEVVLEQTDATGAVTARTYVLRSTT